MTEEKVDLQTAEDKKILRNNLITSIFLMVTSALGPGFLTQTANFTEQLDADFAFAIMLSLVIAFAAQVKYCRIVRNRH